MAADIFTKSAFSKPRSNTFDLTHDRKASYKMGNLYPICVIDTIPGDKISIKSNIFIRLAPMVYPVLHRMSAYVHHFFVPNRIQWDGWEDFITGGEDGLDATAFAKIPLTLQDQNDGDLVDHLGLPVDSSISGSPGEVDVSALPFGAYQRIWDEYYRDQNLQNELDLELEDGTQTAAMQTTLKTLRKRAWQHDYFTSALPWTQKGTEAMLPLGTEAPIQTYDPAQMYPPYQHIRNSAGNIVNLGQQLFAGTAASSAPGQDGVTLGVDGNPGVPTGDAYLDISGTHFADLSAATAASINDLRTAIRLQEWLEKNARGGSRYRESIRVHFGVITSDKSLQIPIYLGGSVTPIQMSEVLQTGQTATTPLGTQAGHGQSAGSGDWISYRCEEHGYIMSILSIMPMSAYNQGIPRHFRKFDKFDYFWPEFAHLGEQAIDTYEIFVINNGEDTFGYTPRYAEYRFINNSAHGDMRGTLSKQHMTRQFLNQPTLNEDFIEMDETEVNDIFAVDDGTDQFWAHILNEVKAQRLMPVFANPML